MVSRHRHPGAIDQCVRHAVQSQQRLAQVALNKDPGDEFVLLICCP